MITPLSSKGRRLLEAITDYTAHHTVYYKRPETYPTYDSLYRVIVPSAPAVVLYVGHNLRKQGLDDLNEWTMANRSLPKVTGLIVDKATKRPGKGFFPCYDKKPGTDDAWWRNEVRKALFFDWSPYVGTQKENSPVLIADDIPTDDLPERLKIEVSRLIRDTKLAIEVKALHNHTCQLCGKRLKLSPGRFYSEAHHLKPLGKPHNGPDRKSNIVCVYPNCHVKLDYSAVRILPGQLRLIPKHIVAQEFIDYHNKHCL